MKKIFLNTVVLFIMISVVSSMGITGFAAAADAKTEVWVAAEISFESEKEYDNPFYDVTMDVVFTSENSTELKIPAFWDGGKTWRVRFAPTETGLWKYETVCTDETDKGLHGISGTVNAVEYAGEYDIYKHGFIKTQEDKRYFTYADGTPFFYLGDTHWGMPTEEFDEAGEHAGSIQTDSHFKYIVDRRSEQNFTVYQSEPIGAKYVLIDGFSESDIEGFKEMDRYFQYIAEKGLVHANAQLVYAQDLADREMLEKVYTDEYLEILSRYWVARYSAYPVLWTTAQEVDNDFYATEHIQHNAFDAQTNPWKKVAEYIHKYDAYSHPLSAHQENTGCTTASNSSFRDLEGHTWYASQWSISLKEGGDFDAPKDYWYNGQGKVTINYEGRYDHLWTKHFGARAQGWTSYLSGMYGYGYGAVDMWLYKSTYDTDSTSNDGIEKITPEDKAKYWSESVEFESAYQMGYMRKFFEELEWQNLIPDFDNGKYFSPSYYKDCYAVATDENCTYVVYFYNRTRLSGVLKNLDTAKIYSAKWFNPRTNEYIEIDDEIKSNKSGKWLIPLKPDSRDWVLLAEVSGENTGGTLPYGVLDFFVDAFEKIKNIFNRGESV